MSNFVQAQTFILHSNASISDTTVTVKDFVGLDGSNLTLADFGTKGFATLNPGVVNAEEAISFTGVTQNGDGTATLTGVSTQLTESPYTETSGLAKSHISGATFVLSNTAGFYDHNFVNKNEDQTISGVYTFADSNTPQVATAATAPTLDAELVHKKFVDDNFLNIDGSTSMTGNLVMDGNDINMSSGGRVLNLTDAVDPQEPATLAQLTGSIAGAPPNASEVIQGVVEEATQAEMNAGTDTGATGAKLFVPPSKLRSYIQTTSDIPLQVQMVARTTTSVTNTGTTYVTVLTHTFSANELADGDLIECVVCGDVYDTQSGDPEGYIKYEITDGTNTYSVVGVAEQVSSLGSLTIDYKALANVVVGSSFVLMDIGVISDIGSSTYHDTSLSYNYSSGLDLTQGVTITVSIADHTANVQANIKGHFAYFRLTHNN